MVLSSRPVEEALVALEFCPIDCVKWVLGRTYYPLPNAAYNTYKSSEYLYQLQNDLPCLLIRLRTSWSRC